MLGFDSFDDFSAKRDQTMVAALDASPNLNPDIAGYDNLGSYGQWQDVAGYGQAWVPNQSSDWAPYRTARGPGKTATAGRGSAEPWGWAPYHYGRWYLRERLRLGMVPPAYSGHLRPGRPHSSDSSDSA